jgi:hypothetical protein
MDRINARMADREWLQQVTRESGGLDHDAHAFPDYRAAGDAQMVAAVAREVARREQRERELRRLRVKAKREGFSGRLLSAVFGMGD